MSTSSFFHAAVAAVCLLALSGCAQMTDQEERMLTGGVGGTIIGTVAVAITGGCIPCGAVIGGAVGTAGGYVVDQIDKYNKDPSSGSGNSSTNYNTSPNSNYNSNGGYNSSSNTPSSPSSGASYYDSNPPPRY